MCSLAVLSWDHAVTDCGSGCFFVPCLLSLMQSDPVVPSNLGAPTLIPICCGCQGEALARRNFRKLGAEWLGEVTDSASQTLARYLRIIR